MWLVRLVVFRPHGTGDPPGPAWVMLRGPQGFHWRCWFRHAPSMHPNPILSSNSGVVLEREAGFHGMEVHLPLWRESPSITTCRSWTVSSTLCGPLVLPPQAAVSRAQPNPATQNMRLSQGQKCSLVALPASSLKDQWPVRVLSYWAPATCRRHSLCPALAKDKVT